MRYVQNSDHEIGDWYLDDEELKLRKPNELWISAILLEDMMCVGYKSPAYRVKEGPAAEARIIGVHMEQHCVVLEYDRPIDEAILMNDSTALDMTAIA